MVFYARFPIDLANERAVGIKKHLTSVIIYSKSKIGFAKLLDKTVSPSFCEAGTSQIQTVAIDSATNTGVLYASTNRGDILVFEVVTKGEVTDCRVKGRVFTKLFGEPFEGKIILETAQNLLYAYLPDGSLQLFKIN